MQFSTHIADKIYMQFSTIEFVRTAGVHSTSSVQSTIMCTCTSTLTVVLECRTRVLVLNLVPLLNLYIALTWCSSSTARVLQLYGGGAARC